MSSSKRLLCDVVIVAETVEMEAHRVVLAACSPYFCAMFTGTSPDTSHCTCVQRGIVTSEVVSLAGAAAQPVGKEVVWERAISSVVGCS